MPILGTRPEQSSRNWCFTVNNTDKYINGDGTRPSDYVRLWKSFRAASSTTTYGICQLEQADTTGKKHGQGYIEFTGNVRFSRLHKVLPGIHFERRIGTRDQARDYCRKEGTRVAGPFEFGEWKPTATRSNGASTKPDLLTPIRDAIKNRTATQEEIATNNFKLWTVRYRAFERYESMTHTPRTTAPEVYVLFGNAGSGKSTYARTLAPSTNQYHKAPGKWWDGYMPFKDPVGHKAIILDDFNGYLPWTDLKLLCDTAPYSPEIKGGTTCINSPIVIFTTNKDPMKWYKWEHDPFAPKALARRVQHWMIFEENENTFSHFDYGSGVEGHKTFHEHLSQLIPIVDENFSKFD